MNGRYFAYGSNLALARMRSRVPGVTTEGVGCLRGYRLAWDKRGADGSGKTNLRRDPRACVWGVVYRLDPQRWPDLDAHEPGYARREVEVRIGDALVVAQTYVSARRTTAAPFAWYKACVVEGARQHGLPDEWVRALEAAPVQPDP